MTNFHVNQRAQEFLGKLSTNWSEQDRGAREAGDQSNTGTGGTGQPTAVITTPSREAWSENAFHRYSCFHASGLVPSHPS